MAGAEPRPLHVRALKPSSTAFRSSVEEAQTELARRNGMRTCILAAVVPLSPSRAWPISRRVSPGRCSWSRSPLRCHRASLGSKISAEFAIKSEQPCRRMRGRSCTSVGPNGTYVTYVPMRLIARSNRHPEEHPGR